MVVLASGDRLTVDDLPVEVSSSKFQGSGSFQSATCDPKPATCNPKPETLSASERTHILAAIDHCHGNISKAADELGISRRTIHRKLKEWKVSR